MLFGKTPSVPLKGEAMGEMPGLRPESVALCRLSEPPAGIFLQKRNYESRLINA